MEVLNDTVNQLNLTEIYKTLHSATAKDIFSSNKHGIFSRIGHTLGHIHMS